MRAIALTEATAESPALSIDTSVGRIVGTWMGDGPVSAGQILDVELELCARRAWDEILEPRPTDRNDEDGPSIRGTVENAFDDGVLVIRIGEAAAQLEVLGSPCPIQRVCEHGGFNEAIDDGVWDRGVARRRLGGGPTGSRCRPESHDELSAMSCGVYRVHAEGANANGSGRMPCNRAGVHRCLHQLTEAVNRLPHQSPCGSRGPTANSVKTPHPA